MSSSNSLKNEEHSIDWQLVKFNAAQAKKNSLNYRKGLVMHALPTLLEELIAISK